MIVETVAKLRNLGHRVILVSSGAVGVGTYMMDVDRELKRHSYSKVSLSAIFFFCFRETQWTNLADMELRKQELAAVGQCRLMSLWDGLFGHLKIPVAQMLLSGKDIAYVCERVMIYSFFWYANDNSSLHSVTASKPPFLGF